MPAASASDPANSITKNFDSVKAKITFIQLEGVDSKYPKAYNKFVDSVDDDLVDYAKRARAGKVSPQDVHPMGKIDQKTVDKVVEMTKGEPITPSLTVKKKKSLIMIEISIHVRLS